MLIKAVEFVRTVDPQPTDEKVRSRKKAAQDLIAELNGSTATLLDFVQGIVSGFDHPPLSQESPSIITLIQAVQTADTTVPHDLKENALELRAVAALAVGELLSSFTGKTPSSGANCAALALRSSLSLRNPAPEQHLRLMLETLSTASDKLLQSSARLKRTRSNTAVKSLETLKEAVAATDLWTAVMPAINAALHEIEAKAQMDREELETLWWLFGSYSNVAKKSLIELSPGEAALCSGIELAESALLPPTYTASEMVGRAVATGRKAAALVPIAIKDLAKKWTLPMTSALAPKGTKANDAILRYPAILPLSWACLRLRDQGDGAHDLDKDLVAVTGVPLDLTITPMKWGSQIFSEKCLQRMLAQG